MQYETQAKTRQKKRLCKSHKRIARYYYLHATLEPRHKTQNQNKKQKHCNRYNVKYNSADISKHVQESLLLLYRAYVSRLKKHHIQRKAFACMDQS